MLASLSYWALRAERAWVRHSAQYVLNNPTWPTEWKQYTVLLAHGHWMQTGDASLADHNFGQLLNNTMLPFIDSRTHLVNFTDSAVAPKGPCPLGGAICNSPMCHNDTAQFPPGVGAGTSCDNIDWLPKFRAGFLFTPTNSIINAFAVSSLEKLAKLANATGRHAAAARLGTQAARTRAAMLARMYLPGTGMWCDGVCAATGNHASFHSQHYLLSLGVTPDQGVPAALAYLKAKGMVGSTYSANSLVGGLFARAAHLDYGQAALDLLTSCADHSWCRMLRANATTTWEHWEPHDGTHAHVWAATPAAAIASGLMGVRPLAPGWRSWRVAPAPGNLTFASITIPTPRGAIAVNFTRSGGRGAAAANGARPAAGAATAGPAPLAVVLHVTIPPGTTATVCLPLFGDRAARVALAVNGAAVPGHEEGAGAYLCVDGVAPREPAALITAYAYAYAASEPEPALHTPVDGAVAALGA